MAENNFLIELIARLNKSASKKQVQTDAKNLGDIKVSLIGTLNKIKTRSQLKKDLASLNGTVNLTGKVDKKGITTPVQQATQQAQKKANAQPIEINFSVKKEKLINDIKLLGQQNSKLFKDAGMSSKYNTLLDNAQLATSTQQLNSLRIQLGAFRSEIKVTGNAGMTFIDALKSGLSKALQLFGGYNIIMQFNTQLRNAWKEAKELDSALTDLSRVNAEISRSGFPDYLDKIISKTKELSVATKDYIDSVTTFSRAGYNLADSESLADMAMQLEKVGDMDAESASKALLSGLQGYTEIDGYGIDKLAEKAQALNDKIDLIGNTASISQKEVAQGIQAVGSVMSDANTSVDEFISLLAAGNRAVQDSNKVALAIRTSALRIRGCTVELQEMGEETDDVIESTSTLAAKIKALTNIDGSGGVNILEADEETFRSIYDIYNDIAKVYDKMSDTDASALLDLIAGKNRSNQISAILQNMSEANELLEQSLSAAGTASAEYEIYLDSAEAATERFGVAMTETYNNILNGETVKGLINAGTAVLDFANKWGIVEGSIKGFLALGILKGITTLTVAFKNSALQVSNYGSALSAVKKVSTCAQDTREYADAMNTLKSSCANLTDVQLKQVLANRNLSDSQLKEILQLDLLEKEQREARLTQLGLAQATNAQTKANGKATASTFSFSSAVKGLGNKFKSFLTGNKITIAIMAISAAISFVTSQISKHNQRLEEARQKAAELAKAYKEQYSSLDSQIEKYKKLKESLDKGNLSTDEARSIKEQLLEIQNSLIESYGNEASNIDLVNGKYREQLGLLSELSKDKANDFIIEHRDIYNEAKRALEAVKTYDLGTVTSWSNIAPKTEDQQRLLEFIESYSDLLELSYQGHNTSYNDKDYVTAVNLSVTANVADADELMHQFALDLEQYINENNIDVNVSGLLENGIPEQIRNTWTDELKEYKEIYDEFMKAEIVRNDTLRPLYQQSIKAVEDYNNALSSGEGVAEAKANLDSVQQTVQNAIGELEGSQEVFDGIYSGINKSAEAAYQMSQTFENDETVKGYAEQLKGLTDIDLQAINFEDNVKSPGEEAFKALIDILGLSADEIQNLIDKLVELGYVQGEVQSSTSNIENPNLSTLLTTSQESLDQFQSSVKSASEAYATLLSGNYSSSELLDSIQTINQAVTDMKGSIDWEEIDSLDLLGDKLEDISKSYAESILSVAGIKVNSDFGQMLTNIIQQMYEVEAQFTGMNSQLDRLQSSYKTLTDVLESYNETGYISLDNLQSLLTADENLIAMLEVENGKLAINQEAYENLVAVQLQEFKEKLNKAAAAEIEALALNKAEEATNNNAKASEDAVAKLDAETEAFKRNTEAAGENALTKAIADAKEKGVSKEEIQGVLDKYTEIWNAAMDNYSKDFPTFMNGAKSSASSAGEDAGKAFTEALDKELNALDTKMEAGYIDFNDYIQARLDLIEDYYRKGKIKADEYYSYLEKHYDKQITYMDKAVSAVTRRIDKEIDALEKQKDDVESIYQVQIDALEKQKTLLEEATKERQQQNDLQKALYDMERAENQRTKLVYTEDKGMIYKSDPSAIRDAKANVDDTRYEIQISQIDKTISKLEEARDTETDAIDDMISKLNEYKDAWNNITSAYVEKQEDLIAAQILGSEWETDILNVRLDVLDGFKNQYIDIQQAIVDAAWMSANEQVKAAKEAEKGASGATSNAPAIEDKYNYIPISQTNKNNGYTGRIDTAKVSHAQSFQKYGTGTDNAKKGLNLVGEDGTETYFDNHGHVAIVTEPTLIPMEGGEVVKNEKETRKLLDSDNLSTAQYGKAFADGTGKYEGLSKAEKNALVSEYGQTEMTVLPNGDTIITDEPTLMDLPKDTVIYNEEQTKQIMNNKVDASGKAHTDGTNDGSWIGADGHRYRPIQPGDRAWELQKAFEPLLNRWMSGEQKILSNAVFEHQKQMEQLTKEIINNTAINNITNNNRPTVTIGDIHVTCPGVTEQQVAKYIPGAVKEELIREFSGLHNLADQYSRT